MDQQPENIEINSEEIQSIVEQRLYSFIESANDAMLLLDEEGVIILANELALSHLGFSLKELSGQHIEVLIPVLSSQGYLGGHMYQFAPHRRLGVNKDLKMFVNRKDGCEFPAKITFSSMDIKEEIYLHVTIEASWDKEIIKQKQYQQERMLKETQRIAKIASWEWDAVTSEIFYSDNFYNLLRISPSITISKYEDFLKLVHEEDRDYVRDTFFGAVREKGRYNIQYRYVLEDNRVIDVYDEGVVDCDLEGNPVRMIGFIQDITERRAAETSLKRYAAELEEANVLAQTALDAKSKFLATMSHELRTPLNGVIGMASLLEGTHLDDEQQEYVQTIYYSGDSLLKIINDILDYAKLDAGALDISMRPFSLRDCITDLMQSFNIVAEHKGLDLLSFVDRDVPEIMLGDEKRVRQVLINLLSNAIKFTNEGFVEARISLVDQTRHGSRVKFSVIDTGIGIPESKLHQLFNSFQQLDNSNARQFGGTGLGLAICKRLIHLMMGEIGVESSSNGSTFWFSLHTPDLELSRKKRVVVEKMDIDALLLCRNMQMGSRIQTWLNGLGVTTQVCYEVGEFRKYLDTSSVVPHVILDIEALEGPVDAFVQTIELDLAPIYLLSSDSTKNILDDRAVYIERPISFGDLYDTLCTRMVRY